VNDWVDAEEHIERAHQAYEAGRWEEAETEIRHALSLNPHQAEWQFNLGLTLEAAERHEDAVVAFRTSFELRGRADAASAVAVGVNLLRAGRPGEALEWLETGERLEPESSAAFVHKIDAHADLKDMDAAEVAFYLGQQADPENPDLYSAMADALLDAGDYDRAIWCLRETARISSEIPRVSARLARAYAATGRQERARQLYHRELRQDPGDIETLLSLGDLLVDMNRPAEAGEKYRRVLELEPDHPEAHFALGDLALDLGRAEEALVQFDVVLRLDAEHPDARRRLAGLLLEKGRDEDTRRARELLLTDMRRMGIDTNEEPDILEELGQLLLDAGLPREAARVFARVLALRPRDHVAVHNLSVAYLELGEIGRGIERAKAALRLNPRFVPAMHNLALAHLRRREWLRARYWARQAVRIAPDDPSLRRLGLLLRLHTALLIGRWLVVGFVRTGDRIWRSTLGRPVRGS
jgi:tetratricopeptide (TPR) repeat protein